MDAAAKIFNANFAIEKELLSSLISSIILFVSATTLIL